MDDSPSSPTIPRPKSTLNRNQVREITKTVTILFHNPITSNGLEDKTTFLCNFCQKTIHHKYCMTQHLKEEHIQGYNLLMDPDSFDEQYNLRTLDSLSMATKGLIMNNLLIKLKQKCLSVSVTGVVLNMIRSSIYKPVHQTIGCVLQNVECASEVLRDLNPHFKDIKELKFSDIRELTLSQKVDLTKYVLHKLSM